MADRRTGVGKENNGHAKLVLSAQIWLIFRAANSLQCGGTPLIKLARLCLLTDPGVTV